MAVTPLSIAKINQHILLGVESTIESNGMEGYAIGGIGTKCQICGSENPAGAQYCMGCGAGIEASLPAPDSGDRIGPSAQPVQMSTLGETTSASSRLFSNAVLVSAIGLVLVAVGHIIAIIEYEGIVGTFEWNSSDWLQYASRVGSVAAEFGLVLAILGLILIVEGIIVAKRHHKESSLIGAMNWGKFQLMLIIALAFLSMYTLVSAWQYNFATSTDISIIFRISYLYIAGRVLIVAAILVIAVEFRKAADTSESRLGAR